MKKVLIADDDIAMIRLYQLHLRKIQAEAIIFNLAQPVIDRVDTLRPDLAILDYDLPDLKGIEILKAIRKVEALSDLPVIFVTGQGRQSVNEALLEAGACSVFNKPFSPIRLMTRLKELIDD